MAKATFQSLQAQIANLQAKAEKARATEISGVVGRIKEAIRVYGLTQRDLFGGVANQAPSVARSGQAKYSDGKGNAWGGRGPRPLWLREAIRQGKTLEEFLVGPVESNKRARPADKGVGKRVRAGLTKVAIKYRDKNGNTWTGRGMKPRWLSAAMAAGAKPEEFLIEK